LGKGIIKKGMAQCTYIYVGLDLINREAYKNSEKLMKIISSETKNTG
jgi:hypothetical protein